MRTAASTIKVRTLITQFKEGKLVLRPEFQRRLVWTRADKDLFIDSVLRGMPFPEIYLADGEVDLESGSGTSLLVDGLQRVTTLIEYFHGSPELPLITVPPYVTLSQEEKTNFLLYDVAVRDLGSISASDIKEVFRRLNATKYSLTDIEVNNAVYAGELKKYCEQLGANEFFQKHGTFNASDYKRMGDLRYALTIVATMLGGYFNRDDAFEEYLQRFNDHFSQQERINARIGWVLDFLDECAFEQKSRVWKKADLFTIIIECDFYCQSNRPPLQPSETVSKIEEFFGLVDATPAIQPPLAAIYHKAALQASNDRINRRRRGVIIGGVLAGSSYELVFQQLVEGGLA